MYSSLRLSLLLLLVSVPVYAEDWPQWRGPNRDGISKEKDLPKTWKDGSPKLLWNYKESGVGYGSPAIVGDKLVLAGAEDAQKGDKEFILSLDTKTGEKLWQTSIGTTAGKYNDNWGAGPRGTPTIDGDKVYALGATGDLVCLNFADGKKVWSINLVKDLGGAIPTWGYSESVLIDGPNLICTPGGKNGSVAAIEKATGKVVWRSKELTDGAGYSSVIIAEIGGIRHYIQQTMASVAGISSKNGSLLWKHSDLAYRTAVIPTPVFFKDHVFVTSGYGAGCELIKLTAKDNTVKSEKVYTNKAMINHHGGVIQLDGFIYGFSDRGNWVCLDPLKLSGTEETPVWSSNKLDKGSITYADGHFYLYGQNKGTLVKIEASSTEWKEVGRFEIPGKSKFPRRAGQIWSHPVVANGKLYLRDHEMLFCFDLK